MNQTYFEWYEFDVNVLRILNATSSFKQTTAQREHDKNGSVFVRGMC